MSDILPGYYSVISKFIKKNEITKVKVNKDGEEKIIEHGEVFSPRTFRRVSEQQPITIANADATRSGLPDLAVEPRVRKG